MDEEPREVTTRRTMLKTLSIGVATLAGGILIPDRPALATGQKYARIVNNPRGSRNQIAMVELRVYKPGGGDMSWEAYLAITGRHPRGIRCHVNCCSRSRGYGPRIDVSGAWPQWYGDRLAFPFLCSGRSQDDDIHVWFEFFDADSFSSDTKRVALS